MKNKKYYWLRLKEDFFKNLRMKKLRSIAGGDTYTIIYLKMQLLSLQDEGVLYYEGVEDSFDKEIALMIDENIEDVKMTIHFLLANNLIEQKEAGVYELLETKNCIGSETDKAELMRKLRAKNKQEFIINGNNVTNVLPNVTFCYTEKEKDIDIDKDIEKENINKRKVAKFQPPTLEDVQKYCKERNNTVNAKTFFDYYEAGNWADAKGNKIKNWKQKVITWEKHQQPATTIRENGNPFFDLLREEGRM